MEDKESEKDEGTNGRKREEQKRGARCICGSCLALSDFGGLVLPTADFFFFLAPGLSPFIAASAPSLTGRVACLSLDCTLTQQSLPPERPLALAATDLINPRSPAFFCPVSFPLLSLAALPPPARTLLLLDSFFYSF